MNLVITYYVIALLITTNLEASYNIDFKKYGIAFFTSLTGDNVNIKNSNVDRPISLHDSMIIDSETIINTGPNDKAFFKLSNNFTFGLLEGSEFKINFFKQSPFSKKDVNFNSEPSNSFFLSELVSGTLAVHSSKLSPLSTFEIHIPFGILKLHMAKCVISYRYNLLRIALYDGNITMVLNDTIHYLNSPCYYINDIYNLSESKSSYLKYSKQFPTEWEYLNNLINIEKNRAVFLPEIKTSSRVAKPELIKPKVSYR